MTTEDAATWMFTQYQSKRFLYLEEAASQLSHLHKEDLAYYDASGNVCVEKKGIGRV